MLNYSIFNYDTNDMIKHIKRYYGENIEDEKPDTENTIEQED